MTLRELVFMCMDEVKLNSDDAIYTEDHVVFLLNKYRSFVLKKELEKENKQLSSSNGQTICLDLIEIRDENNPCGESMLIQNMKKIHQYGIMCAPTTAQYAAIEGIKNGQESVNKMVREYNRRRRVLVDGFRKLGLDCFEPKGAFYVFPSIQSTGLSSEDFCEKLLINQKYQLIGGFERSHLKKENFNVFEVRVCQC